MKQMGKKISVVLVAVLLMTAAVPENFVSAGVVDDAVRQDEVIGSTLPENDELFAGYVDSLFGIGTKQTMKRNYGERLLSGVNRNLYDYLKDKVKRVAAGEIANTKFTFKPADIGIEKTKWTDTELGVSKIFNITANGAKLTDEVLEILTNKIGIDFKTVKNCLIYDCPYELYWFDKTGGTVTNMPLGRIGLSETGTRQTVEITDYTISFEVAYEYKDGTSSDSYAVNTTKTGAAKTAVANARAVVDKYKDVTNSYDRMKAYSDEICSLVSYNAAAVENNIAYGNPWQLIWVFDGDPNTNVVCEGYAKAFQYLCDLTDFTNADVNCYTVNGVMAGGTGAGRHMWNVVTMHDRKSYIVDVTNSDAGTVGVKGGLFVAHAECQESYKQYTVNLDTGNKVVYKYDDDLYYLYPGDVLAISAAPFDKTTTETASTPAATSVTVPTMVPIIPTPGAGSTSEPAKPNTSGDNMPKPTVEPLRAGDSVTVGNEANYKVLSAVSGTVEYRPVKKAAKVVIPATVTLGNISFSVVKIADNAFKGNTKLKSVSVGANIDTIGKNAFSGCKNLKTITIKSKRIKKIGKNAIKGIKRNAVIKVPKAQYKKYKKLFVSRTGFRKGMKVKK